MFSDHFLSKNKMRKLLISLICSLFLTNVARIANGIKVRRDASRFIELESWSTGSMRTAK
jgi:hypothetical protein